MVDLVHTTSLWNNRPKSQEEFEDTKGVIRIRKSQNRQHNGLELEDTKGR